MSRLKMFLLCIIFINAIIFAQGCSVNPSGIKNIFASTTPTLTDTPTSTNTPRPTSTTTSTPTFTPSPTDPPIPPVTLYDCAYLDDCPEAIPVEELTDAKAQVSGHQIIEFSYDQPIRFVTGWIASDQAVLEDNLTHINWIITIDGQNYFREDWLHSGEVPEEIDPSIGLLGAWFGVVMSDWEIGKSYEVQIGYLVDEEVFNGWDIYPANESYVVKYLLRPQATTAPNNTPGPITNTPLPTCTINGTILIKNDTGGWISIYLTGPAKFNFDLPAGNTTINVCPGQYSFTAYGCGGATRSGSVTADSEELTFTCN